MLKLLRTLLLVAVLSLTGSVAFGVSADGSAITPDMCNEVAGYLRDAYGSAQNLDQILDTSSVTNLSQVEATVGNGSASDYGQSQRLVIHSIFALGASMDNATWRKVADMFNGVVGNTTSTTDTLATKRTAGLIGGSVMIGALVKAFATMDIYLQSFFGGIVYFALLGVLMITMGVAMIRQMHEGRFDIVAWLGKAIVSIIFMFKANQICNYILAAMLGFAAVINSTVIHGITSEAGMDDWYLKIYGPQILQGCYALISGSGDSKVAISKAFNSSYDIPNLQRYVLYENGKPAAADICKYLGGSEGYNSSVGGSDTTRGVSLKEMAAFYELMVVYNVGYQNLMGRSRNGETNIATAMANFKLACAQLYWSNDKITAGDITLIDRACGPDGLALTTAPTRYQYLSVSPNTADANNKYLEPGTCSLDDVVSKVQARSSEGFFSALWSKIRSFAGALEQLGAGITSIVYGIPASIMTWIMQGLLQILLLGGLLIWMLLAIGLCKLGVILVVLTSPLILVDKTAGVFWKAVKVMWYPSIYPAMLIIIMQMTSVLSSWIGTMAAQTMGVGLVLCSLPLILGLGTVIMLPKIVKSFLEGGNLFISQLSSGLKAAAVGAAIVATGGAAAGVAGGAAAAGGAGGAAGAAGGAAGAGAGAAGAGGAGATAAAGSAGPTTAIGRAMAGTVQGLQRGMSAVGRGISTVANANVPGTGSSYKRTAAYAMLGGIPGVVYALSKRKPAEPPKAPQPVDDSKDGGGI